jgi:hypothetical protein
MPSSNLISAKTCRHGSIFFAAFLFSVKELPMAFQEFTTFRGILAAEDSGARAKEFGMGVSGRRLSGTVRFLRIGATGRQR